MPLPYVHSVRPVAGRRPILGKGAGFKVGQRCNGNVQVLKGVDVKDALPIRVLEAVPERLVRLLVAEFSMLTDMA